MIETAENQVDESPFEDSDCRVNVDPFDADSFDAALTWREDNFPRAHRAFKRLADLDREKAVNEGMMHAEIEELEVQIAQRREWQEAENGKLDRKREYYILQLRGFTERECERTGEKHADFPCGRAQIRAQQPEYIYPVKSDTDYLRMMAALEVAGLTRTPPPPAPEPDKTAVKKAARIINQSAYLPGAEEAIPGIRVVERDPVFGYETRSK